MTAPLLAVRGVKTFYGNIMALKGIDLDVNEGEIVTLIGANGAGKSTLMMTTFGNPRASEGVILFEGRDITRMPTHEIAKLRIAQSPEGRRIFPRMTVLENLQMGATVCDPAHFEPDLKRVCALFPLLDRRIHQRGGGATRLGVIEEALPERRQRAGEAGGHRIRAAHLDEALEPHVREERRQVAIEIGQVGPQLRVTLAEEGAEGLAVHRLVGPAANDEEHRHVERPLDVAPVAEVRLEGEGQQPGAVRVGVLPGVQPARDEAVVDENVFLHVQRAIEPLEIASGVPADAVAQDEVLRPRRRADRIGLDETEAIDRALQRRWREEAARDGVATKVIESQQQGKNGTS